MILRIYNYILEKSKSKYSIFFLSFISFVESIFFPLPTDFFIVPMVLANRNKVILIAFIATFFSVIGGVVSYYIGVFVWEELSNILNSLYDFNKKTNEIKIAYKEYGFFAVFIGSFTPFPYKIISLISGILSLPIIEFIIYSFIFRGLRFFIVAYLIFYFGEQFDRIFKKYTMVITLIIIILFIMGYFSLKFI